MQTQGKYNLWIIILVASSSELNMCLVLNLHGRFILQLSLLILLLVVTTIGWHGASTLHHLLSLLPGLLPGRPRRSHDETLPLVQVRISLRRVAENHLIIPHAFLISPYSPLPFEYTLLKYMRRMHSPPALTNTALSRAQHPSVLQSFSARSVFVRRSVRSFGSGASFLPKSLVRLFPRYRNKHKANILLLSSKREFRERKKRSVESALLGN